METAKPEGNRLFYIDNLRFFMMALVVLHHLSITYGAPGDWYYNESEAGFPEILPMAMFVSSNQSFFMGMFFFVSAFFIVPSLIRKGASVFIRCRLVRLGIPILVFFFFLSPLANFIRDRFIEGENVSLLQYITSLNETGFGPLWFIEALLILTAVYLFIRPLKFKGPLKFPPTIFILLAAALTGLAQFIIRIWLPVGWSMPFTNFQFPFFVQYILLFILGIVAYQNNWLQAIDFKTGKRWFLFAQGLIFFVFPAMFGLGSAAEGGIDKFMGGINFQSLSYSLWEQLTGFSLMIGLAGIFKEKFNSQGSLAKKLSGSAYGVFVFHAPVIVGLCAVFVHWGIFPFLKFIVLAPLALFACFAVAFIFKQIPGVKKVL